MDRICDLPSFIVAGASVSGKTTLIEQAVADSYSYIPTHTTRLPRSGEVSGVHSVFLREEQFESNFREGLYIEDSLEFAYMPGIDIYYGYPRVIEEERFLFFSGINPNCKKSILYVRLRCKLGSSRM